MGLVPGSLIFIVIVAIWAAYLLQHWVGRREHAAATRSVDRFSEAMRVLEKRPLLPTADLREPRPHSYAVTLGPPARPTVEVKRALPAGAPRPHSPLVARRGAAPVPTTSEVEQMKSQAQHRSPLAHRPPRADQGAPRPTDPFRGERPARPVVSRTQRRLRAGLLLASLVWVPTSIVLAITGLLMWISVPFALLTFAAVIVWLRTEAAADRARAAGDDVAQVEASDHSALQQRAVRRSRELTSEDTQVISAAPTGTSTRTPTRTPTKTPTRTSTRASSAVYDVMAAPVTTSASASMPAPATATATAASASTGHGRTAAPAEGTWEPVPVPRPTYTMKVKAAPRLTPSGIPADVFDTPEFSEEADELDERALFARRAASL